MTTFESTITGHTVRLDRDDHPFHARIGVTVADGARVEVSALDVLTPIGFEFDTAHVDAQNVDWLIGHSLDYLREASQAGRPVRVTQLHYEARAPLARAALLAAFQRQRYFPPSRAGLVHGERLALLVELEEQGLVLGSLAPGLAMASAASLISFIDLSPLDSDTVATRAVRAARRHIPAGLPGAQALSEMLDDVADPDTVILWAWFDDPVPAFRGSDGPRPGGDFVSNPSRPVLWPASARPGAIESDEATLDADFDEAKQTIDVKISPVRNDSVSPPPCLRAVAPQAGRVLATAPLFWDGDALRGHLYLDERTDEDAIRLEVAALPDSPVLGVDAYVEGLITQLSLAFRRAQSLGDRSQTRRLRQVLHQIAPDAVIVNEAPGGVRQPSLADRYGTLDDESQPSSE